MNWSTFSFISGFGALWILLGLRKLRRDRALRAVAAEFGFVYARDIPANLTFHGTGLAGVSATWNEFTGERHGVLVVMVDSYTTSTARCEASADRARSLYPFLRRITPKKHTIK